MANVEPRVRLTLSDWKVWMGIAYFGLAMTVIALYILFGKTAHEEATRAAAQKSANVAQVEQCFNSVKNAPVVAGFLAAQDALIDNGLESNRQALLNQPGVLTGVRERAIVRLMRARHNSHRLAQLIQGTTPNRHKCFALAASLKVDARRYRKGK